MKFLLKIIKIFSIEINLIMFFNYNFLKIHQNQLTQQTTHKSLRKINFFHLCLMKDI